MSQTQPSSSPSTEPPEGLADAYRKAEQIAARDLNNLYLTSCYFLDRQRYWAFCAMYAVMRVVDDRIDAIPSRSGSSTESRNIEHQVVDAWQTALETASGGKAPGSSVVAACDHPEAAELLAAGGDAMERFPVPTVLWRNFFAAMHRDIDQPRFATYQDFLDYTEGASVSPTTIYLYLIAAARPSSAVASAAGPYVLPPGFDLITCGRHLGTFAYLGHILRDLAEDLSTGEEGLIYVASEDLASFGLDEDALRRDLANRRASSELRQLVSELRDRSRHHLRAGRRLLAPLDGVLEPDGSYILELILTIYERVLDKIETTGDDPMAGQHHLDMDEKLAIASEVAARVGFNPED